MEYFAPIFPYLDVLKLDIPFIKEDAIVPYLEQFKNYDFKLLAEKVETREVFELYKSYGCTLFQGYYFAKPDIIKKQCNDTSHTKIFHLINLVSDEKIDIKQLTREFESEIELTIQLLRFMNSAYIGLLREIKSISHVIVMFGKKPLKQWLLLIASSHSGSIDNDFRKNPIIDLAISRAHIMSQLALKIKRSFGESQEASFVGILSLVDALLNISIEDVLQEIRVESTLKDALIEHKGWMGKLLELAIAIEQFDITTQEQIAQELGLSQKDIAEAISQ